MNECTIFFGMILLHALFNTFWNWCNSNKRKNVVMALRGQLADAEEQIHKLKVANKEEIKKINDSHNEVREKHQQEINRIKTMHRLTLKKRETERHKSCQRRNEKIQELTQRVEALKVANAKLRAKYSAFKESTIKYIQDWE